MQARAGDPPAYAALRLFGSALLLATAVVGLFGVLRLTRQFPAAAASPGLLLPFLLPVLALALEAGALVAFSASALQVCRRIGASAPARWAVLALLFASLLAVLAVAEALPRGTERPGAFANELVQSARQSCSAGASVPVPLLGLSVRCEASSSRIEGPMPGAPRVQVAMKSLHFSDDLRRVHIEELDLTARRWLSVRLRAKSAQIAGLSPWTRSPRLSPFLRGVVLSGVALGLGLAVGALWRFTSSRAPLPLWQRVLRSALGGLPGLAAAVVVIGLDQEQAAPLAYWWGLVAALAAAGVLAVLRWRAPKIFSSFSAF